MADRTEITPEEAGELTVRLKEEVAKVIVGQERVVEEALTGLLSRGHVLLVGVPGLAKTLLVKTISDAMDLGFSRIQFTPDLMPSDITGTDILDEDSEGCRVFRFLHGPIFANVILADEINRTPPKTQAALLQAMQELQVTASGKTYQLEAPFFVLATQNPIEQEGTYPLPEAQLDRFMLEILVDYPTEEQELRIVKETTSGPEPEVETVITREKILALQGMVRAVPVPDHVVQYAVALARATRPGEGDTPGFISRWVAWGAGPRASQNLILGAKARALLHGRNAAVADDVLALAAPVFRHRIILNFSAEAEGVKPDRIISDLVEHVKKPSGRI